MPRARGQIYVETSPPLAYRSRCIVVTTSEDEGDPAFWFWHRHNRYNDDSEGEGGLTDYAASQYFDRGDNYEEYHDA